MKKYTYIILTCVLSGMLYADRQVEDSRKYRREGAVVSIISGTVALPSAGFWSVDPSVGAEIGTSFFVDAEEEVLRQFKGRRMGEVVLNENINKGRYPLSSINWRCRQYAQTNANTGPVSTADLGTLEKSRFYRTFVECPWPDLPKDKKDGPFYYLVPTVRFEFEFEKEDDRGSVTNKALLAFELRPYLDDGKHWVSYTDGTCNREKINEERMAKYGQTIRPIYQRKELFPDARDEFTYTFLAAVPDDKMGLISLPLTNTYTGARMSIDWDLADTRSGDATLAQTFREYQSGEWGIYYNCSKSSVLGAWIASIEQPDDLRNRRGRRNESTSAFGVMGGYAAARETLQMQLISVATNGQERTVSVESIEGVKVESHPFREMLGGNPGGRLELAELVPADRFFVYLSKPEAMLPLLNEGADFISRMGSAHTGNSIKYYLKKRYLKRLGMDEKWVELFLCSGGVSECALMAPDMFFIDGTDVTVISRLATPELVMPLLKMLGVPDLSQGIAETKTANGQLVYWTVKGDLLMTGTSKVELEQVLRLVKNGGKGSLGASDEFRYMLTQLPLNGQTRAYAYCSDPFIRRLVGPETKIGQLRRVDAMGQLQRITSAALLAQLDGMTAGQTLESLKSNGYLPTSFATDGYSLDKNLVAHSDLYGNLANIRSLSSVPVEMVTDGEAKAYKGYVENYSRFWRQFFDPIALRLDDMDDGSLEATMFILPLIDSSIYSGIKEFIVARESGTSLKTPRMKPEPVLQLSMNLNDKAWMGVSEGLSEMLMRYVFIDPAILDDLGSSLHLMVHDADPVIALGSGDLLGGFGGGLGNSEELLYPMILSVLTRPCTIAIETGNPAKTATYLRNAVDSYASSQGWEEISSELYQVGDGDSWVCLFDVMGMVKMRFGLEVKDGFLLIRNIPWSNKDRIQSVGTAELNAATLKVFPSAGKLQLAGLHSTASEKNRTIALQGMGLLFPLIRSGGISVAEAGELHMKLFGYTPYQPFNDRWSWKDMTMESERYGSVYKKKQPVYIEGDTDFGLMESIEVLEMQMQFEDTGLRTKLKWKAR